MNHPTALENPADEQAERPALRSGGHRWQLLLVTALCGGTAGFLAGTPFWTRLSDRPVGAAGLPTRQIDPSWRKLPAFSEQATAEQLKQAAADTAEALLRTYPESPEAMNVAARLRLSLGQVEPAVALWRKCIEINPRFADAYFGLGLVAKHGGDFDQAADMLARVAELVPDDLRVPALLGESLLKAGRAKEAVIVLERHLQAEPEPMVDAVASLAQAYLELEQYPRAQAVFQVLAEAAPNDSRGHYGLARVYAKLGEKEKSRQALEVFRKLAARNQQGLIDSAREESDVANLRNVFAQTLSESGQVYADRGDVAKAEEMWQKAAHVVPGAVECRRRLLALYDAQQRDAEALAVCRELCRLEPNCADHWLNAALLAGRLQQLGEARSAIGRAMEIEPGNRRFQLVARLLAKHAD